MDAVRRRPITKVFGAAFEWADRSSRRVSRAVDGPPTNGVVRRPFKEPPLTTESGTTRPTAPGTDVSDKLGNYETALNRVRAVDWAVTFPLISIYFGGDSQFGFIQIPGTQRSVR